MTLDDWVQTHAFLRPIADLQRRIDAAIADCQPPCPPLPVWRQYEASYHAGIPLLDSGAAVDLGAIETVIGRVMLTLQDSMGVPDPGLLRCVGWRTIATALRPLVAEFANWRDEDRWRRPCCPTCGAGPAMAHMVGVEPGRQRFLVCGCCATRWRYARTTCPFCESESHRLASLGIVGEGGLRIDYCDSCHAYLKTYNGHGDETVLLADWTSVHLDFAAQERGWRRAGTSLYEVGANEGGASAWRSAPGGAVPRRQ
jgi:FdhE protein